MFIGLSSAGGYVLWLWALKNIAATRVTVFLALSPITGEDEWKLGLDAAADAPFLASSEGRKKRHEIGAGIPY